jgi:uncharacterized protein (DUF433 family)
MATKAARFDLSQDPRELPAYGVPEAAHYLQIPASTVRSWVVGRPYLTQAGKRFFKPLIELPQRDRPILSFFNLVEVHVLDAIRRKHGVRLMKVRRALDYLSSKFPSKHPLADHWFETDGLDLFVEKYGQLINISREGQLEVRDLIHAHLQRIERDSTGVPIRLYPFTRKREPDEPKAVVIDPRVSFGRPVLAGTGIATAVVAERFKAGEPIDSLAEDYARSPSEIEEAIRCELQFEAA